MRMFQKRLLFWFIIALSFIFLYLDLPSVPLNINLGFITIKQTLKHPEIDFSLGNFRLKRDLEPKLGLDLQGGTHLVLSADMKDIPSENRDNALESAKNVIERRVNFFGVSEPLVQSAKVGDDFRVIVELAGVSDVNQAKDLVGQTAKLEFRQMIEATPSAAPNLENTGSTGLTGKDLKSASAQYSGGGGTPSSEPVVAFKMTTEGSGKFADLTRKLEGKPLAIFLDDRLVTAPIVREPITGGEGIISGGFNIQEAKKLAIQLNAGALPVPVKIVEERTVGATLGSESVSKSIVAGVIGLITVSLFMTAFYGRFGVIATVALLIYTLLNISLYKLIPVTLTLAGIAGFILSVGMAVDANILIFERVKEELRSGQRLTIALEVGFKRAWSSIRDSNVSSLITSSILYWQGSGLVKGFALTLAIGILTSMLTSIVVTRTFLRVFKGE